MPTIGGIAMLGSHIRRRSASNSAALSGDEQETLKQLEALSKWLDASIPIPGTSFKIGWDTIIGLVPGIGDAATAAISSWIVFRAKQLGISKWALARMIANVGIDALLGAIPLVGDVFDAAYKANQKNISLLRRQLEKRQRMSFVSHDRVQAGQIGALPRSPGVPIS